MNAVERFNGLNGNIVTRNELSEIIDLAKSENQTDIIFRLSSLLNEYPDTNKFEIEGIEEYQTQSNGLNAPRHSGSYKQALDECGRLKPGWKFENGSVVKVLKKTPKKVNKPKVNLPKKEKRKITSEVQSKKEFDIKLPILPNKKNTRSMFVEPSNWNNNKTLSWKEFIDKEVLKSSDYKIFQEKDKYYLTVANKNKRQINKAVFDYYENAVSQSNKKYNSKKALEDFQKQDDFINSVLTSSERRGFRSEWNAINSSLTWEDFLLAKANEKQGLNAPSYKVPEKPIVNDVLVWAEKNLYGKHVYHQDIGKKIHFSQSGIKKAIYGKRGISKIRLQLVYVAKQFLQSSRLITIEKDNRNRNRVLNIYKLNSFHTINNQEYKIFIVIRETENGILYYDHEGVKIKKHVRQPGGNSKENKSTPLSTSNVLSENKDTKKGLNNPNSEENTGFQSLAKPNPLIMSMSEKPNKDVEYFNISGDFGKFLGKVEKKPVDSVAITLDAPQGAGKTRFFFFMMNELAKANYKCLFVSLEEHPLSDLFQQKKDKYISDENLKNIDVIGELPNGYKDLQKVINSYDCIFIDSWGKLAELESIDFDRDLRKKFNGKLFFVIFQRTVTGTMRGGAKSQFDGDIIMKIEKDEAGNFRNNFAFHDKNRYQSVELDKLKFNLFTHKLIKPTKTKKDE